MELDCGVFDELGETKPETMNGSITDIKKTEQASNRTRSE
jgi:hypothetical protein